MSVPQKSKKLTIWLIQDGEQLPLVDGAKPMRTWRLGEELARRGHEVIWWSSNFHHMLKKKVCDGDLDYKIKENFTLKLLDCGTYKKNLSLARILHHHRFGKKLHKAMRQTSIPDRIVASHPSIESSYEGTQYGKEFNVPVIVDVRDMWPDIFKDYFPSFLRHFIDILSYKMQKNTQWVFENCTALTSMSLDLLKWANKGYRNKKSKIFYIGAPIPEKNNFKNHNVPFLDNLKKEGKIIITFLGTFGKTYDLETILDVIKRLKEKRNDISWVLAGNGEKFNAIEKKSHGIENLFLTGWLTKEESSILLSMSDAALLPVKNIALPNKFGEYISHGLPVMSSAKGEIRDIINYNKIGYTYDSKESLISIVNGFNQKLFDKKKIFSHYKKWFKSSSIDKSFSDFVESTT